MKKLTIRDVADIAIVAAIYVVLTVTPPLNAISYGAYQFRISEWWTLWLFTILSTSSELPSCMIANFFSFGLLDVFVGGGSTLVFLSLGVWLFANIARITSLMDWFEKIISSSQSSFNFYVYYCCRVNIVAELPFSLLGLQQELVNLPHWLLARLLFGKIGRRIDLSK